MSDPKDKREKVSILTDDGAYETFNANPQDNTMTESLREYRKMAFGDKVNRGRLYDARKKKGYGGD